MEKESLRRLRARGLVVICGAIAVLVVALHPSRPLLVWNASSSSPVGLYLVRDVSKLHKGERLIAWAPRALRRLADRRGYVPYTVPLVKPVAAIAGDEVCAIADDVVVDGTSPVRRLKADAHGRRMPWWSGCQRLRPGEVFLMSADVPQAFDGRYFGVTRPGDIIGEAILLWER